MNTQTEIKIVSVEIEITLYLTSKHQIGVEMPSGFISGDGGDAYFSECDGIKFADIFPAFENMFPLFCRTSVESTPNSGAWIDGFGFDEIDIAGNYQVRFSQIFTKGNGETEFDWLENQVAIVAKN
jgi:hypothetical protein